MQIPIYQVDAFTAELFGGNPAAVCLLAAWPDDRLLQNIAAENNLSETAFLVANANGFDLRWFTPVTEVALCGHATLASAQVLFARRQWPEESIRFRTRRSGEQGGSLSTSACVSGGFGTARAFSPAFSRSAQPQSTAGTGARVHGRP